MFLASGCAPGPGIMCVCVPGFVFIFFSFWSWMAAILRRISTFLPLFPQGSEIVRDINGESGGREARETANERQRGVNMLE